MANGTVGLQPAQAFIYRFTQILIAFGDWEGQTFQAFICRFTQILMANGIAGPGPPNIYVPVRTNTNG